MSEKLTEHEIVGCIVQAHCIGTVKLSYDSGPFEITKPTLNATKLARAIEERCAKRARIAALEQAKQLALSEPRVFDPEAPDPQHRIAAKIQELIDEVAK